MGLFDGIRGAVESVIAFSDPGEGDGYFPDGRVAQNSMWYSPVTSPEHYGVPVELLFQTGAYPERDDGPQYSWDQGLGRSPGQQWPHKSIREQFSFESTQNMSGIMEDATADLPADSNANPLVGKSERTGWAMSGFAADGDEFYQQDVWGRMTFPDPTSIAVPGSAPLVALMEVE